MHLQEVQKKFEKYGDVTLSRIVRNPVNGESRGFGFVDMKDDDGADDVRAKHPPQLSTTRLPLFLAF